MQVDLALHPNGEGEEIPGREIDRPSAVFRCRCDGGIDGFGIVGFAIALGTIIEYVVKDPFRLGGERQARSQQQGKNKL